MAGQRGWLVRFCGDGNELAPLRLASARRARPAETALIAGLVVHARSAHARYDTGLETPTPPERMVLDQVMDQPAVVIDVAIAAMGGDQPYTTLFTHFATNAHSRRRSAASQHGYVPTARNYPAAHRSPNAEPPDAEPPLPPPASTTRSPS